MARHDGDLTAAGEVNLDIAALLDGMRTRSGSGVSRNDAIARYLAAADGWRDAGEVLGGAFAADVTGTKEERDR